MNQLRFLIRIVIAVLIAPTLALAQGSLTPPGPPAPGMKTLQQVEPRFPISSAPFTITVPGSYYLTTNLVVTSGNAIQLSTGDVVVDLGGWEILCLPGASAGVAVFGHTNIVIRNGTIRGASLSGINGSSASSGMVENIAANDCALYGIEVGDGFSVLNCSASRNGLGGITTGQRSQIRGCQAEANSGPGIRAGRHSLVEPCTAAGNSFGFEAGAPNVSWFQCVAANNSSSGFRSSHESTKLVDCSAMTNFAGFHLSAPGAMLVNCSAQGSTSYGFQVTGTGVVLQNCSARANASGGYFSIDAATYRGCIAAQNGSDGFQTGSKATVFGSVSVENVSSGFTGDSHCSFDQVRAVANGDRGITFFSEHNTVRNSVVSSNASYGIWIRGNSSIADCTVNDNARGGGTTLAGILLAGTRTRIDNNTLARNGPYGIFYGFLGGITNNVIIRNHLAGHTSGNLVLPAGNHFVLASAGNLATNLNPYVNFSLP